MLGRRGSKQRLADQIRSSLDMADAIGETDTAIALAEALEALTGDTQPSERAVVQAEIYSPEAEALLGRIEKRLDV